MERQLAKFPIIPVEGSRRGAGNTPAAVDVVLAEVKGVVADSYPLWKGGGSRQLPFVLNSMVDIVMETDLIGVQGEVCDRS